MMGPELFRGQYALAKGESQVPENFQTRNIAGGWQLHAHAVLPVAIVQGPNAAAVLVGHALDWSNPGHSQQQVLERLVANWTRESILERSACLAGRWALAVIGEQSFALNDACGTMGVAWNAKGLASSAQLLNLVAGPFVPIARQAFDQHRTNNCHSGRPLPGTATEFEGVRKLLGNHALDLDSGTVTRFHPRQRYDARSAGEMAPRVAEILRGIIAAASNRAPLALGLTSGYDSRALAAALSSVPDLTQKTTFFTMQDEHACPAGHFDISGAKRIAEVVGGSHQVIVAAPADQETSATCRASEHMIAPRFEAWAQAWAATPSLRNRIVLSGWCSETGRARLRWEGSEQATPGQVLGCLDAVKFPEFLPDIRLWHSEAVGIRDELNLPIIDLLYWELKGGGWIAAGLNILNTGADCISAYSCRELLDTMLSVAEDERGGPAEPLYTQLIGGLRPELLQLPFNPRGFRERTKLFMRKNVRNAVIRSMRRAGVYDTVRRIRGRS